MKDILNPLMTVGRQEGIVQQPLYEYRRESAGDLIDPRENAQQPHLIGPAPVMDRIVPSQACQGKAQWHVWTLL